MSILITRPRHDYRVSYLFYWGEEILEFAKKNNLRITDFKDDNANKENVEKYLRKQQPRLVVFNGHGDTTAIYGHKDEPLIVSGENEDLLKSKITYAIACDAAADVGKRIVEKGGDAFIGYENKFCFVHDTSRECTPPKDKLAEPFKNVSNTIVISLLKGNPVGESIDKSKRLTSELIRKYSTSDSEPGYAEIRFWLFWNRFFLRGIGNLMATFTHLK